MPTLHTGPSLYRRVLGERFDALPEVLRRFHGLPDGGRAHGRLRVERAKGRLRNGLANLLGMPKSGLQVPVQLRIEVRGDRERWVRHFGGRPFVTEQWERDGLLMERSGAVTFSCAMWVDGARLHYEFRRAWFLGLPMPRRLSPSVVSWVDAGDGGWTIVVRIFVPILGALVSYEGWVEPESE
jgi:Domain of unknown function (DUF4166)